MHRDRGVVLLRLPRCLTGWAGSGRRDPRRQLARLAAGSTCVSFSLLAACCNQVVSVIVFHPQPASQMWSSEILPMVDDPVVRVLRPLWICLERRTLTRISGVCTVYYTKQTAQNSQLDNHYRGGQKDRDCHADPRHDTVGLAQP